MLGLCNVRLVRAYRLSGSIRTSDIFLLHRQSQLLFQRIVSVECSNSIVAVADVVDKEAAGLRPDCQIYLGNNDNIHDFIGIRVHNNDLITHNEIRVVLIFRHDD